MKTTPNQSPGLTALALSCLLLGLLAGCATHPPAVAVLQRLQGTWEGAEVGHESDTKITLTITGHSLRHYAQGHGYTNQVFEATFTLPAGTHPQQLRAILTGLPPDADRVSTMEIGEVVPAILKFEDGTLSLARPPSADSKPFADSNGFHYKLRKVQPQTINAEASTSK
jgi:hypothetical protein